MLMPVLLWTRSQNKEYDVPYTDWLEIQDLGIDVNLSVGSVIDATLVVADTWNTDSAAGTNFAIAVQPDRGLRAILVEGLYTGTSGQRVPITLQCVANLRSGPNHISVLWKTRPGGIGRIGSSRSATLKAFLWNQTEVTVLSTDSSVGDLLVS
jgi:hypothetical protein